MPDFYQTPRYQLPDDWSPEGTICVKITIPNDQQYYGQLIGLLDTLKWSKNFAPDATKLGAATVSRTWQAALESAPISVEGCDMPEFRINPDNCLLEINCSDDPESPDWKTIITQLTDPRTDIEYPPPYPDPPPSGETNECLAAANLAEFVWYAGGHLAERLGTGAIITEVVVAMAGIIATFFQLLTTIIVDETLILFVNISPGTVDDDWLLLDKQDFIDLVVCYLGEDGDMDSARWGEFLDELIANAAGNQAWYLVYYVCVLMGFGGFNLAARLGGITEADCASCDDCSEIWDFELECPVYTVIQGVLSDTLGVDGSACMIQQEASVPNGSGGWQKLVHITIPVARDGTITNLNFDYYWNNAYPYNTPWVAIDRGGTNLYTNIEGITSPLNTWFNRSYTMSVAVEAGDVVTVIVGYGGYATEAEADASIVRLDNLDITPRNLFD